MRIVTRGDLDGLVSSVLISEMEDVDSIVLVHPQDITDKKFEATEGDILANLPYHPSCSMWFDHHQHTVMPESENYRGRHALAPSVARVVYDYYGSERLKKYEHLVAKTDCFDSANLSRVDVLDPRGAILLGFLIDPRTGMGGDFREFFGDLVQMLREKDVEEVLAEADLVRRVSIYRENSSRFKAFLLDNSRVSGNVVVTDFRQFEQAPIGNRFLVYAAFPQCNVSVRMQWGPGKSFVAVNIGHSIFERTCLTDVGKLCREYGGGGHRGAGACVLDPSTADSGVQEIVERLVESG
jgi:hypothetical protein